MTEVRAEVSEQLIVRHYRATTRSEVEDAYRTDALQAARAGYIAMSHTWTQDADGFLLAVSYGHASPAAVQQPIPQQPIAQQPAPQPQPPAVQPEPPAAQPEPPAAQPEPPAAQPAAAETRAPAQPPYQPVQRIVPVQRIQPAQPVQPTVAYEPASGPTIVGAEPRPVTIHDQNGMPSPAVVPAGEQFATNQPVSRPDPFAPADPMESAQFGEPQFVPQPTAQPPVYEAQVEQPVAPLVAPLPEAPDAQWLPPSMPVEPPAQVERYTPPPEMYLPSPDMYVPVTPSQPVAPEPEFAQPVKVDAPLVETAIVAEAAIVAESAAQTESAAPPESAVQTESAAPPESAVQPASAAQDSTSRPRPAAAAPGMEPMGRHARLTVQTMDLHAAGEPLRIIRSGYPDVPMLPVLERRRWVKENADHVRQSLMFEPRGHKDMYGAILLPPYNEYADMTVLFMHNEGYSTMCGHGIIAITTGLIEEGLFPATEPVTTIRYEVPAGIVAANAATEQLDDGTWTVRGVRFTNVPSYLAAQSLSVRPDGVELHGTAAQYGALGVDLAFGGAYYGLVNAAELGLRVVPEQAEELRRAGAAITDVLRRDHTPAHPTDPDLSFVYGTIIVDLDPRSSPDGKARDAHIRNATIFAEGEFDRSPCGSGTSAILAQLHARGRIRVGQEIVNAGITGEHFLGRVEAETTLGAYAAVSTSIAGTAFVTGYSTFIVDSRDPLGDGFLLR